MRGGGGRGGGDGLAACVVVVASAIGGEEADACCPGVWLECAIWTAVPPALMSTYRLMGPGARRRLAFGHHYCVRAGSDLQFKAPVAGSTL